MVGGDPLCHSGPEANDKGIGDDLGGGDSGQTTCPKRGAHGNRGAVAAPRLRSKGDRAGRAGPEDTACVIFFMDDVVCVEKQWGADGGRYLALALPLASIPFEAMG